MSDYLASHPSCIQQPSSSHHHHYHRHHPFPVVVVIDANKQASELCWVVGLRLEYSSRVMPKQSWHLIARQTREAKQRIHFVINYIVKTIMDLSISIDRGGTYRWSRWMSCWMHPRRIGTECRSCQRLSLRSVGAWTNSRRSWPLCERGVSNECFVDRSKFTLAESWLLYCLSLFDIYRDNKNIYFVLDRNTKFTHWDTIQRQTTQTICWSLVRWWWWWLSLFGRCIFCVFCSFTIRLWISQRCGHESN